MTTITCLHCGHTYVNKAHGANRCKTVQHCARCTCKFDDETLNDILNDYVKGIFNKN